MLMTLVETGERRAVLQVMADEVTSWTGLVSAGGADADDCEGWGTS